MQQKRNEPQKTAASLEQLSRGSGMKLLRNIQQGKQRLPWSNLVATATLNYSGMSDEEVNCDSKDFFSAHDLTSLRHSAVHSSRFCGSLSADKRILPSPGSVPRQGEDINLYIIAECRWRLPARDPHQTRPHPAPGLEESGRSPRHRSHRRRRGRNFVP